MNLRFPLNSDQKPPGIPGAVRCALQLELKALAALVNFNQVCVENVLPEFFFE